MKQNRRRGPTLGVMRAEVIAAPYFSLSCAARIPCALTWDEHTGEFRRIEGPRGFETYHEALEASRFLRLGEPAAAELKPSC